MHIKEWTCHKCYGVFPNGWNRHHHVRQCMGVAGNVLTELLANDVVADINEAEAAPESQFQTREVDTAPVFGQEVRDERIDDQFSDAEVQMMRHYTYTQTKAKSHIITPKDLEILMFLQATECGVGTSREQKATILHYIKGIHTPRTNLLPKQVATCFARVEKVLSKLFFYVHSMPIILPTPIFVLQLHEAIFGKAVWREVTLNVPTNVQELMSQPTNSLTFRFLDPVECLIRLLTMGPLSSDMANLALYPEQSRYYADFNDGEKLKRIYQALPAGSAALTSVLFFDSINRDAKGFNKGDGIILVGAFFKKSARESSLAKMSLSSFPTIHIAKTNVHLKVAPEFNKAARKFFYSAIYKCYADFNAGKGVICELQNGDQIHFAKAIIIAIYTDQPVATKMSVTGSACPQCFTAKHIMGTPPRSRAGTLPLRTPEAMNARRLAMADKSGITYICSQ